MDIGGRHFCSADRKFEENHLFKKIMKSNLHYIILSAIVILGMACEQSDPPDFGRFGDVVKFSGLNWDVKTSENTIGPGNNFFSGFHEDVYVDDNGYLHMKIAEHGDRWYSSEVISQDTMGYGTYSFTVEGDFTTLPDNVVVGLFTWDNNTFLEEANSEVDIEFSKWGADKENTLQYGVQPIAFSGDYFAERVYNPDNVSEIAGVSTHLFHWTDTLITWESYTGDAQIEANKFNEWSFDLTNPARVKVEGGQSSQPIIIPAPGSTTNARINFWLLTYISPGPSGGETQEFIVRSFDYTPL
ncbi:MAG: hypothetical protein ACI8XB_003001 [Patiriisocius sp.]